MNDHAGVAGQLQVRLMSSQETAGHKNFTSPSRQMEIKQASKIFQSQHQTNQQNDISPEFTHQKQVKSIVVPPKLQPVE